MRQKKDALHKNDITYDRVIKEDGKACLVKEAYSFGVPYTLDELDNMTPNNLRKIIYDYVMNHTQEWIEDLPLHDLRLLSDLVKGKTIPFLIPRQAFLTMGLGFVDCDTDFLKDNLLIFFICKDVKQAVAPLLDKAMETKKQKYEDIMEEALNGVLNMVGMMEVKEMEEILCRLIPYYNMFITKEQVSRFMEHSMLVRYMCRHEAGDGGDVLLTNLLGSEGWEPDLRKNIERYPLDDVDEVIAHGTMPYLTPYRECEKDFYDMLKKYTPDQEKVTASYLYTQFYARAQDHIRNLQNFIVDIVGLLEFNMDETNENMPTIVNFCNCIPKMSLKGNSSKQRTLDAAAENYRSDIARRELNNMDDDFSLYSDLLEQSNPFIAPEKVGRNDPCPCGSGKKYKNCCGKGN